MGTAVADRNLLFGLLALQNGLIDQDQLINAFRAWTRDKARAMADHLAARGDLDPEQAPRWTYSWLSTSRSMAATRRRAWPPSRSALIAPEPRRCRRPRGPRDAWPASGRTRPTTATPTAPRRSRWERPPATASGSRSSGLMPAADWRGLRRPRHRAQPRGGAQADPRSPRRRPGQPRSVRARSRDHRRAGASGHRAGLRPGHLPRRSTLLRHAVHPGRQPQGGHRRLSCRSKRCSATRAGDRWRCGSCCGGSSTCATRSTTPTAEASCTATSSRATSSWASTARPWWSTGVWPSAGTDRARGGVRRAAAGPFVVQRECRDAPRQCAGDAGLM